MTNIQHATRIVAAAGLLLLAPATGLADQADTREYTVLIADKPAGERTVTRLGAGKWRYHYTYNDRGRGPDVTTTLHVDRRSIPTWIASTGKDYIGNPVDETLARADGVYRWRNANERGERPAARGRFYISVSGAADGEHLVHALLKARGRALALLPEGEARIRRVTRRVVRHRGERARLTMYAIEGLGFAPVLVWLDADKRLFYDGHVILRGWEAAAPELREVEIAEETARAARLARKLERARNRPLVFRNARVFDPASRQVREGMSVVVRDGRIAAVGASVQAPRRARIIDAAGRFLMPGLWDMHAHLWGGEDVGLLHLAGGVTAVRDLANDIDVLLGLRERWHAGKTIGPRVFMAGFIDGPGPYAGPTKVLVSTQDEAEAAVRRYAELGYEQIKLYNSLDQKLLPGIIATARALGLRVSGHIPVHLLAEEAVRLGYDEIQHINHLFLNFLDRNIDNRTPARFTEVAARGAELDLASPRVRRFIALLKQRQVVVDPTLAIFESQWVSRPGDITPAMAPVAGRLPPLIRRLSMWSGLPVPEGMDQRYKDSFRRAQELVRALHEAGVPIVAGTDAIAGFTLHRELELYVEAGIPAADVLYYATLGSARVLGHEDDLGTIEPGKRADLVLVDGDPLADMRSIRRVVWIVRDGRLYRSDELYRALGMKTPLWP